MVKSVNRSQTNATFKFSVLHIIKILVPLWFIYILFVPLGYVFGRTFSDVYGSGFSSLFYIFSDLTGLSYLLGFLPKANETWWFFGEIIRLYIFFPLFYYSIKKNSSLTLFAGLLLCFRYGLIWFLPFILGMIFAEKDFLSVVMQQKRVKKSICGIINFCLIVFFTIIRQKYGAAIDGFYAIAIICFLLCLFSPEKPLGKALVFIGKHSFNIFMFHTFIYLKYMYSFIYGFRYPLVIFFALTIICLVVSIGIETLKKLVRYEKFHKLIADFVEYAIDKFNLFAEKIRVFLIP